MSTCDPVIIFDFVVCIGRENVCFPLFSRMQGIAFFACHIHQCTVRLESLAVVRRVLRKKCATLSKKENALPKFIFTGINYSVRCRERIENKQLLFTNMQLMHMPLGMLHLLTSWHRFNCPYTNQVL